MVESINGRLLKNIIIRCSEAFEASKQHVDAMNVFPVPDGDTGTNMSYTLLAAAREAQKLGDNASFGEVVQACSYGALRGARGNSGVILSQLFRGFAKELDGKTTVSSTELANGFVRASETAYKAVMKPKEGTILTVAREISKKAVELSVAIDDINELMRQLIDFGNEVLGKTPDMLPILKQAGVVDAGGQGLMLILSSAYSAISGINPAFPHMPDSQGKSVDFSHLAQNSADIEFVYCTEFFVDYNSKTNVNAERDMKAFLDNIGDSIVVVADETIMKVHVHTNAPGTVLDNALQYGMLSNIKIENMRIQHSEIVSFAEGAAVPKAYKPIGIIAVSSGSGFAEIFKSLSIDELVEGGQTLNPSSEDILKAINRVNADDVIIFPNNKNIVLAAEQAAALCEDKRVHVIPTRSLPEGINAAISFMQDEDIETNLERMRAGIDEVSSGQVTCAVRSTTIDGLEISEGDYLCILNGKIIAFEKELGKAALSLAEGMAEGGEILSIFYGEGVTEDEAKAITNFIEEKYPALELELQYGGQPVYQYIIAVQ